MAYGGAYNRFGYGVRAARGTISIQILQWVSEVGPTRMRGGWALVHYPWTALYQLSSPDGYVVLVVHTRKGHAGSLYTRITALYLQCTLDQHPEL